MAKPKKSINRRTDRPSFSAWYRETVSRTDPNPIAAHFAVEQAKRIGVMDRDGDLRKSRRVWNQSADIYPRVFGLEQVAKSQRFVFSNVQFSGNENVLSVGSGTGIIENFIAQHCLKNGKLTGVDIADNMNKKAAELREKTGAKNFRVVTGSSHTLPIRSESQDIVLYLNAGEWNVHQMKKPLSEIFRVIRKTPKAKFLVSVFLDSPNELQHLKQMTSESGFDVLSETVDQYAHGLAAYIVFKPRGNQDA